VRRTERRILAVMCVVKAGHI